MGTTFLSVQLLHRISTLLVYWGSPPSLTQRFYILRNCRSTLILDRRGAIQEVYPYFAALSYTAIDACNGELA